MPSDSLQLQLEKLHAELHGSHKFNEKELSMLEAISKDIQAIETEIKDSKSSIDPIRDQVNEAVVHFDQEHPTMFKLLQEISDVLGRMGI